VRADLFHAGRRTGMTKLTVHFLNFVNAPKNGYENSIPYQHSHIPFHFQSYSIQPVLPVTLSATVTPSNLLLLCRRHYVHCDCAKAGHWPASCYWTMEQAAESENLNRYEWDTHEYQSTTDENTEGDDRIIPRRLQHKQLLHVFPLPSSTVQGRVLHRVVVALCHHSS
jgi:hypothetical protein